MTDRLRKEEREGFTKRWGWLMIAKNVSDFCNDTFFNTMKRTAIEVLTLAMLVEEQNEIAKANISNNGRS